MSWIDREINFKKVDKPKLTEAQIAKKKKERKWKIPTYIFDYTLLIYFTGLLFFPEYVAFAGGFLTPFMGVVKVLYIIFLSFISIFTVIAVGVIGFMTYTTKLDDITKEPTLPDVASNPFVYTYAVIKSIYWIYLASALGFGYLSVLTSIIFIFGLAYKYMEKDFITKMTKLALSWEEPEQRRYP